MKPLMMISRFLWLKLFIARFSNKFYFNCISRKWIKSRARRLKSRKLCIIINMNAMLI